MNDWLTKSERLILLWFVLVVAAVNWAQHVLVAEQTISWFSLGYLLFALAVPAIMVLGGVFLLKILSVLPPLRDGNASKPWWQVGRFVALVYGTVLGLFPAQEFARLMEHWAFSDVHGPRVHSIQGILLPEVLPAMLLITLCALLVVVFNEKRLYRASVGLLCVAAYALFVPDSTIHRKLENTWFRVFAHVRPVHMPPGNDVVIIDLFDAPVEPIVRLAERSGARVIALTFRYQPDSAMTESLRSSSLVTSTRRITDAHYLRYSWYDLYRRFPIKLSVNSFPLAVRPSANSADDTLSRHREAVPPYSTLGGHEGSLASEWPVRITPVVESESDAYDLTVQTLRAMDAEHSTPVETDREGELRIGKISIPIDDDGQTLVNPYTEHGFADAYGSASMTQEGTMTMTFTASISTDSQRVRTRGMVLEFGQNGDEVMALSAWEDTTGDRDWKHLLQQPQRVTRVVELEDKIVIIGHNDPHLSTFYATTILNALTNDFLRQAGTSLSWALLIVTIVCIVVLYEVFSPLKALSWSLAGSVTFVVFLFWLLSVHRLYIPPDGIFFVLAGSVFLIFPVEVYRERTSMLEDRAHLSAELRAAHDMQMGLMPKEDPVLAGYEIASACIPANEVGGDFYDYVWLDKKHSKLGIAVADVSGKAMKAAMTAVLTSGMLYSETQKSSSPREVLRRINHPLYLRSDRRVFTALSFGVIDLKTKNLTYSCAGQIPPVLIRKGKNKALRILGIRLPLGLKEDLIYKELRLKLQKGDVVVFSTDGIVEAMNAKQEMYGFERVQKSLEEWHDLPATMIRDRLISDVKEHIGTAPQHDDMTVVVVKVLP